MVGAQPLSNRRRRRRLPARRHSHNGADSPQGVDGRAVDLRVLRRLSAERAWLAWAPVSARGRRPDLLSPCRGDLSLARAAFDRKPRLWPDCRFVASGAVSTRLPLFGWSGSPADVAALGVKHESGHLDRAGLTLLLRNDSEHVDLGCAEYRDRNDAGVSPALGSALVFAKTRSDGQGPGPEPARSLEVAVGSLVVGGAIGSR